MTLFMYHPGRFKREVLIDDASRLGTGGEGTVYYDKNDARIAVKIFSKQPFVRKAKIEAMLQRPPSASTVGNNVQLAWANGLVIDSLGIFHGLTMPRVDTKDYCTLEAMLISSARSRQGLRGDGSTDYRFRITVARNLALAVAVIHDAGHAIVDLKPLNILVHRVNGGVAIIDCDGCRIQGAGTVFPAMVATEEYLAPEFHGKVQDADFRQDLFALPMVIFRLLNNDLLPMTGVPADPAAPADHVGRIKAKLLTVNPAAVMRQHAKSIQDYFPAETVNMFRNSFSHTALLRPTANQWVAHLDWLSGHLCHCNRNRKHSAFPSGCPWCVQEARTAKPVGPAVVQLVSAPPSSSSYLVLARIISFPFVVAGILAIIVFLTVASVVIYGLTFGGERADLNIFGKTSLAISIILWYGGLLLAATVPFYYCYLNSFASGPFAKPGRAWPSLLLGVPLVALDFVILRNGYGVIDSIVSMTNSWSGLSRILLCLVYAVAIRYMWKTVKLLVLAVRGIWNPIARIKIAPL
jgi:serine/threonine protein kinase